MKSIARIIKFTGSLWRLYVFVSLFSILVAVASQVQPLLLKNAIDQMTRLIGGGKADVMIVAILALLIFAADLAQTLFSNIGGYYGDILSARLRQLLSHRYFEHLLTLPQRYYDHELSGRILNRMNRGIMQIAMFIQAVSNNFLQLIFSSVLSLGIIYFYSWQVGLMMSLLYPVFVGLTILSSPKWQGYQEQINTEYDTATGRFAEAISQIKVVKSYARQMSELRNFGRHFTTATSLTKPQSRHWHSRDVWRRLALNIIFLGVYAYVFVATAHGVYSIGTMVLLIMYANNIRLPLFSISFIIDQSQRAISNSKDYFAVMDEAPEITDQPGAKALELTDGRVVFDKVTFGYDANKPVFRKLSFELKPDTKNALVGESGEGKTTITNLLLRLYEINDGHITIDGQDIGEVTQASLHQNIGVVFQEPALFSGTIRENIAYGRPRASLRDIKAAAKAANADEFIRKFEKGYDSEIGERGLKLSGGQKQRIAIARALLKDAPILILDEATSNLDTKSEREVQQALERLMEGRTTLIIAHRLSTIQSVDQIISLRRGHVEETGTPDELAKSGGSYSELLHLQQLHTAEAERKIKAFGIKD